jgi:hypothetical protein
MGSSTYRARAARFLTVASLRDNARLEVAVLPEFSAFLLVACFLPALAVGLLVLAVDLLALDVGLLALDVGLPALAADAGLHAFDFDAPAHFAGAASAELFPVRIKARAIIMANSKRGFIKYLSQPGNKGRFIIKNNKITKLFEATSKSTHSYFTLLHLISKPHEGK